MKEFSAQTGGRYTYVDDILNLQNLALAFASIFDGCDNFIVSGCRINGTAISDGYVYINGRLRYFPGSAGITSWPRYIYESNMTETVAYANGADKVGRNVYGCAIDKTVPTVIDPLTNAIPQHISISANGGKQLKDALFGKYALILDPSAGIQSIKGTVNFSNDVSVNGACVSKSKLGLQSGNNVCQIYYDGDENLVVQSRIGEGVLYKFVVSNEGGFRFYVDDTSVFEVTSQSIHNKVPVIGDVATIGNIKTTGNYLYNTGVAADTGAVYINTLGHNGSNQYFRDTYIGNGKGTVLLEIKGKDSLINMYGGLCISGSQPIGLVLKSNFKKASDLLQKTISWADSDNNSIGYIGYNSVDNNVFEIHNDLANVSITGLEAVNIGPVIMENGVSLAKKYASITYTNGELKQKADANDVYSIKKADEIFAQINNGLSQFVIEGVTKETLRRQIEAVSLSEVEKQTPLLKEYLADMAKTDAEKQLICKNIGATYKEEYQKKLKDSGWIKIKEGLFIRQIGNMVSIQGYVDVIHSGTVFTIPNTIDSPTYAVSFNTTVNSYIGVWRCHIDANSRNCVVDYCNNHGVRIPFSITYMV